MVVRLMNGSNKYEPLEVMSVKLVLMSGCVALKIAL